MTTSETQHRWRRKHRYVKRQLNVMAPLPIHEGLEALRARFDLRGKGEGVTFAVFLARVLLSRAEHDPPTAAMLDEIAEAYHRDRDLHAP